MTKKKKRAILFSAIALVAIILVGTTLAYFTDTDAKQNVFTIGNVTGSLNEKKDGKDTKDDSSSTGFTYDNVKPGDSLDKEPYVELGSTSQDAYARIKVTVSGDLDAAHMADVLNGLTGTEAGWYKVAIDDTSCYFYYQNVLSNKTGGATKTSYVFTKVNIPSETWGNEVSNKTFKIDVVGDLIQADNFTPVKDANGNIIGWNNSDGTAVTIENAK